MTIYDLATLADQLAELYPTIDDARRILTISGFNTVEIEYSTRPRDNWWNILQVSAYKKGALHSLLEYATKDHADNKLISVLLVEIIQQDSASAEAKELEAPVTKRKRLIKTFEHFLETFEDKNSKKGLFAGPAKSEKDLQWFQQLIEISQGVGWIKTEHAHTSAILLADGYVLTFFLNANIESLRDLQLILQYDSDEEQLNKEIKVELDASFVLNNEKLYYTLLKRNPNDPNFGIHIPVIGTKNCIDKEINLISHPLGKAKRISGGTITGEKDHELFYSTDSAPGSAGGPVICNQGVVAMHVGRKESDTSQDTGVKFGIKIEAILKDAGLPIENFMN